MTRLTDRTTGSCQVDVVTMQAENETAIFEGEALPFSTFIVSNHSESGAFSTQ